VDVRGKVRKLVELTKIHVGSWNVGSLTGKLRELVDAASRVGGVLISYVSRRQNGRGKTRRWRTLVSSFGTQEQWHTKME
jgi:hypothetical protein